MLTPHAKDPNRKDELERKAARPEAFGRTKIPAMQSAPVTAPLTKEEQATKDDYKGAIREARNTLIAAREALAVAESNLNNAGDDIKPATVKKLEAVRDGAQAAVADAEQALNELIDA